MREAIFVLVVAAAAGAFSGWLILKVGQWHREESEWSHKEVKAAALAYHQVTTADPKWTIVARFAKATPQSKNVQVTLDHMPPSLKLTAALFLRQLQDLAPTALTQVTIEPQKRVTEQ